MTEAQWLTSTDPARMLDFLGKGGEASARKLRLFALACCRRIWPQLKEREKDAVALAERFADRRAAREELRAANDVESVVFRATQPSAAYGPADARQASRAAAEAATEAAFPLARHDHDEYLFADARRLAERAAQALLLRDILGPAPFRPLPGIIASVLAWNRGVVQRLAEAAYAERALPGGLLDHARLAVLADALEQSGCTDAEMLNHLRSPCVHVRGCWPLDLVLCKA